MNAEIIKHSINPDNKTIITYKLEYPRFIHSELMTHRVFSRNASSSRAIPFSKMISYIEEDMALPIYFGSNKKGMQAGDEVEEKQKALDIIKNMFSLVKTEAQKLNDLGLHKQICNRYLEPFSNIRVLVTSTEWDNFFALRHHRDAQPEINELADRMLKLHNNTPPEPLDWGHAHLPFIDKLKDFNQIKNYSDEFNLDIDLVIIAVSSARCARVSYLNYNGTSEVSSDIDLFMKLLKLKEMPNSITGLTKSKYYIDGEPKHMSPLEHIAFASEESTNLFSNFKGYLQLRHLIPNENIINEPRLRKYEYPKK